MGWTGNLSRSNTLEPFAFSELSRILVDLSTRNIQIGC